MLIGCYVFLCLFSSSISLMESVIASKQANRLCGYTNTGGYAT